MPETAVEYTLYGDSVYVIKNDGKDADGHPILRAIRTPVKTGLRWDGKVAILDGLKPGERVVAAGQVKLQSGVQVASPARRRRSRRSIRPCTDRRRRTGTMSFTDIFIRRPVLALVVSLLILLIGLAGDARAADPAVPQAVEHDDHGHHDLSRRRRRI